MYLTRRKSGNSEILSSPISLTQVLRSGKELDLNKLNDFQYSIPGKTSEDSDSFFVYSGDTLLLKIEDHATDEIYDLDPFLNPPQVIEELNPVIPPTINTRVVNNLVETSDIDCYNVPNNELLELLLPTILTTSTVEEVARTLLNQAGEGLEDDQETRIIWLNNGTLYRTEYPSILLVYHLGNKVTNNNSKTDLEVSLVYINYDSSTWNSKVLSSGSITTRDVENDDLGHNNDRLAMSDFVHKRAGDWFTNWYPTNGFNEQYFRLGYLLTTDLLPIKVFNQDVEILNSDRSYGLGDVDYSYHSMKYDFLPINRYTQTFLSETYTEWEEIEGSGSVIYLPYSILITLNDLVEGLGVKNQLEQTFPTID